MTTIYHIAEPDRWDPQAESYEAESLTTEGFIHCSTAAQLSGVVQTFYTGRSDLILLSIDPDKVEIGVIYEDLYGHGDDFPHVYGPIVKQAIISAEPFSA